MKAIEAVARINKERRLVVEQQLPVSGPSRVRVIILVPEDDDIDEAERLRAAATNPAFDFLKNLEEDIYTLTDGEPFGD